MAGLWFNCVDGPKAISRIRSSRIRSNEIRCLALLCILCGSSEQWGGKNSAHGVQCKPTLYLACPGFYLNDAVVIYSFAMLFHTALELLWGWKHRKVQTWLAVEERQVPRV